MSQSSPLLESVLPGPFFARFVSERGSPLSVLCRGLLERLLAPARLDALFGQVAQEQYTRELLFSSSVELLAEVVLKQQPSVRAAYRARGEEAPWAASLTALYEKLAHAEPALSAALVADSAAEAGALCTGLERLAAQPPTPLLAGFRTRIVDGNALAPTQRRLAVSRTQAGAPLPGKSLVILDADRRLVEALVPCEDAHTQERALLDPVLQLAGPGELWLADRNFCTRAFVGGLLERGAAVLIRQHAKYACEPLEDWQPAGRTPEGAELFEQRVRVLDEDGRAYELRRVRVVLPATAQTRGGERELLLLTNLGPRTLSAGQVAALYRQRWGIETVFAQLEAHLQSEVDTLAYPRAALLGFAVAALAYNALALVRRALGAAQGWELWANLSMYYLAHEVTMTYQGMMVMLPAEEWSAWRALNQADCARLLYELAGRVNARKLAKAPPRGPKKPAPARVGRRDSHYATARLLAAQKANRKQPK